jgi:cytochrome c6
MADPAGLPAPGDSRRSLLRAAAVRLLVLALLCLVFWPAPARGIATEGAPLFDLHCAGCHPQGGNIIRRGRTLRESALRRQGIEGSGAVAAIAASGIGRMDGYAAVLGEGGAAAGGGGVWQQALAGWPRLPLPLTDEVAGIATPSS